MYATPPHTNRTSITLPVIRLCTIETDQRQVFFVSASSDQKDAMDPQCDIPRSRH